MWRRLKAPVTGPKRAWIGRHISEVAATRDIAVRDPPAHNE
jgi:hypothetical protein